MRCYSVEVKTTNGLRDQWKRCHAYLNAGDRGVIYVLAETMEDAARFVGEAAKSITDIGPGYWPGHYKELAELERK